jgi:hypothetical protein
MSDVLFILSVSYGVCDFYYLKKYGWIQIDKIAWDSMQDHAELHLQSLEPWVQVLFKTYFY